jgi:hypothetical protein
MADVEENPYHYTGLHAFGFLKPANVRPPELLAMIRELGSPPDGPVIWAGTFVGDYAALVHVRVDDGDLGGLQELIEGAFWDLGARGQWAIEAKPASTTQDAVAKFVGVKRGTQEIIVISSLRVRPGSLDEVLEQVQTISTFRGASVVFGGADVLVQLGADAFEVVASSVERELQAVTGIVGSSTAFCDGRR